MSEDALDATFELVDVFAALGIPYLVGGSLASTTWGEARFTQHVDLVVEMTVEQAERLGARLEGGWYANVEAMKEAIARHRSFNVVRLRDMVKIDVFVPPREGHHAAKWERGLEARLDPRTERTLRVTSPEDIVLQKLAWYDEGGRSSDRQWRDVVAVLRLRADSIDDEYLDEWARRLGLTELLSRAREDAHE